MGQPQDAFSQSLMVDTHSRDTIAPACFAVSCFYSRASSARAWRYMTTLVQPVFAVQTLATRHPQSKPVMLITRVHPVPVLWHCFRLQQHGEHSLPRKDQCHILLALCFICGTVSDSNNTVAIHFHDKTGIVSDSNCVWDTHFHEKTSTTSCLHLNLRHCFRLQQHGGHTLR